MNAKQKNPFPYYVGAHSLEDLANKNSRVCIMNIMGNESRQVTPTSHEYSGGNIVAGVHYGRSGQELETEAGNIPVFGSVKEVIAAGVKFDTGVIYLPPAAVNHAVSELCANNPDLEKIILLTEKISVYDAKMIRYGCQQRKVDVFGANCLGIANAHDHVRVGGALGGDKPEETLKPGSVAVYSNSGNFSSTMTEYLKTSGFGTSTILSSGKDVIIHFALAEFLYCAENDPRTKAILCYIEPGGYYEQQALDMIANGDFKFTKPIIACVTGRWKKNLSRACGHAGAMAGGGDDAEAKEAWFDAFTGVGEFDPKNPVVSKKGVRIATIQDIPEAMAAVMKMNGVEPDFEAVGDLSLKPWFVNHFGKDYPDHLKLPAVEAVAPYDEQIARVSTQVGAQLPKESMRNRSGASMMNPKTQVTELYGKPLLELVEYNFAKSAIYAITKAMPTDAESALANAVLNSYIALATGDVSASQSGRANNATPNAYIAAQVLIAGNNKLLQAVEANIDALIDLFYINVGADVSMNSAKLAELGGVQVNLAKGKNTDQMKAVAAHLVTVGQSKGVESLITAYAKEAIAKDSSLCAISLTLAASVLSLSWASVTGRRLTRKNAVEMGTHLAMFGIIAANAPANPDKNDRWKALHTMADASVLDEDYTSTLFQILFARPGEEREVFALNAMLNLTITNGPGTISGMGAKESVSAKNNISVAYAGFMANTGLAHGGNGFEAVAFLMEVFADFDPYTATAADKDAKLKELAHKAASDWGHYKKQAKIEGNMNYSKIPCVNHPVFKGKAKNIDPREEFIWNLFATRKTVNPFQEFYHILVQELFEVGATKNVFCVNIDAVIATISLDLFWKDMKAGKIEKSEMQDIVFIMFLFARMVGSAAEITDHRSRGTDMDCRTPASQVEYVM